MNMPGREEQQFKGQEIKKPVLTGGKAGLASLLCIGVLWSCRMGWEMKGIVMLFLKYQPSLASGPAESSPSCCGHWPRVWHHLHTPQGSPRDSFGTEHTANLDREVLAAIPVSEGIRLGFRGQNPCGTVSNNHLCAPCPAKLFLVTWRAELPEIITFPTAFRGISTWPDTMVWNNQKYLHETSFFFLFAWFGL